MRFLPDSSAPQGEERHVTVYHPFLIAAIPILHLVAYNKNARVGDAIWPLLISLGFTVIAFLILRWILKSSEASGLIVSLFLFLFFSYGLLAAVNPDLGLGVPWIKFLFYAFCILLAAELLLLVIFRDRLRSPAGLSAVFAVTIILVSIVALFSSAHLQLFSRKGSPLFITYCILLAGGTFLITINRSRLEIASRFINVTAAVLMLLVLFNLGISRIHQNLKIRSDDVRKAATSKRVLRNTANLPDIYYIILDAYGGQRILSQHLGYDNSEFLRWLESRGFYVADRSSSNYSMTSLSLPSSLNLDYINSYVDQIGKNSRDVAPMLQLIENNSLMLFLKSRGYKFVFFGSGFNVTQRNRYADISYDTPYAESAFVRALLNTTAVRYLYNPNVNARRIVLRSFSNIPKIRNQTRGPIFLFAHISIPHEPYLFNRDGGPGRQGMSEGQQYLEQLMFVNKKVEQLVDRILLVSPRPPVIVIQGDHGPKDAGSYTTDILNAYHMPGGKDGLYPNITPVNSFRVVLNDIFHTAFPLLEDRSYISDLSTPYSFKRLNPEPQR